MRSRILMHIPADPVRGAAGLLRSLSLARHWNQAGGSIVYVIGRMPGVLLRQIAIAGCDVAKWRQPERIDDSANALLQMASDQQAGWMVLDDSCPELVSKLNSLRRRRFKLAVLGSATDMKVDLATGNDPSYALLRPNLPTCGIHRRGATLRCMIDLTGLSGERSAEVIKMICKRFVDVDVSFDIVTPFATSAVEQLNQQKSPMREKLAWHRNTDRVFFSLATYHLAVSSYLPTFFETASAGLASLCISPDQGWSGCGESLTTIPWRIHLEAPEGIHRLGQAMEHLIKCPDERSEFALSMLRLVDHQGPIRLVQALGLSCSSMGRRSRSA